MEEQKEEQKKEEEKPDEKEKPSDAKAMEGKKEEQKEEESGENKMSTTIFLFLLITAIIKDAIEILLGLIPGINLFVWAISLPFTLFIFVITFISGLRATWLLIGQILDLLPLASVLPIATVTVILCYIFQKLPAPLKKTVAKASKLTSLKPSPLKKTAEKASKLTSLKPLETKI